MLIFASAPSGLLCPENYKKGQAIIMNQVTLSIQSKLANARLAALCAKEMAANYFTEAEQAEIEIAVAETINNSIEHACAGSEDHTIAITYSLNNFYLSIDVKDNGKTFESNGLEDLDAEFNFDPDDFDSLPESGMGLKIIKSCMDKVLYQNTEMQNHWLLIKFRPAHSY